MSRLIYGDYVKDGVPTRTTIHGTEHVDVELDDSNHVVAVWFRCMLLPFRYEEVDFQRESQMRLAYEQPIPAIDAIIFDLDRDGRP